MEMSLNIVLRQTHRWVSFAFLITVGLATYAAISGQDQTSMLFYLPLPPLFLLMATGFYMFLRPYILRWRGGEAANQES
jgi:FtsH-binding integral membrane protein